MADLFGYAERTPQATLSTDNSKLTVGGADAKEYLVQNWQANYQQDIAQLFEIGSDAVYWVKGHPTGNGSIQRLVGPAGGKFFPDNAFDACNGGVTMELTAMTGCHGDQTAATVSLTGVVVTTVGLTMQAPGAGGPTGASLSENFSFQFSSMSIS